MPGQNILSNWNAYETICTITRWFQPSQCKNWTKGFHYLKPSRCTVIDAPNTVVSSDLAVLKCVVLYKPKCMQKNRHDASIKLERSQSQYLLHASLQSTTEYKDEWTRHFIWLRYKRISLHNCEVISTKSARKLSQLVSELENRPVN